MASFVLSFILLVVAVVITTRGSPLVKEQEYPNDFWRPLPGSDDIKFLDISAKNGNLWGVAQNYTVWRYDSQTETWANVPFKINASTKRKGFPAIISATNDGLAWLSTWTYHLFPHYAYRWNPSENEWDVEGSNFRIVSGITKDQAIGIPGDGVVEWDDGLWNEVEAPTSLIWAALGDNNDRWLIQDFDMAVFHWEDNTTDGWAGTKWVVMPDTIYGALKIDSQNASRVVVTTMLGNAYTWTGRDWNPLPIDNATKATIDYNNVYVTDSDGNVFVADF